MSSFLILYWNLLVFILCLLIPSRFTTYKVYTYTVTPLQELHPYFYVKVKIFSQ